jgi:hypothetical protein
MAWETLTEQGRRLGGEAGGDDSGRGGGTLVNDRARTGLLKLPRDFMHPVCDDVVEEIGPSVYLLKVRDRSGRPDESQVTSTGLERAPAEQGPTAALSESRDLSRWIEGQRIQFSFASAPVSAVSTRVVRGLPEHTVRSAPGGRGPLVTRFKCTHPRVTQ